MTADVPKVSRVAGLGIVKLAQMSGRPIYPVAIATRRRIVLDNWDRTTINLPFGRGAGVAGAPIYVPRDADDATLELARRAVEEALNAATARAYEIADGAAEVTPVADRAPLTLRAYRLLTAVATPFAAMVLNRRLKRGKELAARLPERRGESSIARPDGPLVWMHGASVGEMLVDPAADRAHPRARHHRAGDGGNGHRRPSWPSGGCRRA